MHTFQHLIFSAHPFAFIHQPIRASVTVEEREWENCILTVFQWGKESGVNCRVTVTSREWGKLHPDNVSVGEREQGELLLTARVYCTLIMLQ